MTAFDGEVCPTCGAEVAVSERDGEIVYRCSADDHMFSHVRDVDGTPAWEKEPSC